MKQIKKISDNKPEWFVVDVDTKSKCKIQKRKKKE